jgi:hypothetical protein
VTVDVGGGSVEIAPSADDALQATVNVYGRDLWGARAQQDVDVVRASWQADPSNPGTLRLVLDGDHGVGTDVTVTAPPNLGLQVSTGAGDVRISGWQGPIRVTTARGGIQVASTALATAGIAAESKHGPVLVQVPPTAGLDLDAACQNGTVDLLGVDLPGGASLVKAPLHGGGPLVIERADDGMATLSATL